MARLAASARSPGDAAQIQIMYGLHGERSLDERELPWLSGYENSSPVRIGNAASGQVQLDVFRRSAGMPASGAPARPGRGASRLVASAQYPGISADHLGAAGPGHVGKPRRPTALHLLQDHGLGCRRPHDQGRHAPSSVGAGR